MVYLSRIVILHSFVKLPDGRWVPLGVIGWKQASWCLRVTLWKPPWIPTTDTELQIQMMAKLWRFIRWLRRGESSTLNDPISAWWIAITLQNGTERWTTWHFCRISEGGKGMFQVGQLTRNSAFQVTDLSAPTTEEAIAVMAAIVAKAFSCNNNDDNDHQCHRKLIAQPSRLQLGSLW